MEDFSEYCDGEYDEPYDHAEYLRELHGGEDNSYQEDNSAEREGYVLAPTALPWMTVEQVAEYVRGDGTDAQRVALADGILQGFVPPTPLTPVVMVTPCPLPPWPFGTDDIPF